MSSLRRSLFAACLPILLAALVWALRPTPAASAEKVDLLLVMCADISRSVDEREFRLQRDGYAAALTDPRVIEAISTGENQRIGVLFCEWSGYSAQRVVIDWRVISSAAEAKAFATELVAAPRAFMDRTSIGAAIDFSMQQFARTPFEAPRRVIDISGDGTNTHGREPRFARDSAVEQGVTINGLVILSDTPLPWNPAHTHPPGGLENYYRENVIGGPGGFVLVAENFDTFGRAMLNKLIKEIASSPGDRPVRMAARRDAH